ncbi:uncharacterized protein [Temnothorax longispinosus]|uniref:uncharacterized protein isoform X2 n=1 Tax=Temnothorax longispinosus TaxID=300112 RepID=UPI003A99EA53
MKKFMNRHKFWLFQGGKRLKRKKKVVAAFVDPRTAFDSVDRRVLGRCLKKLGSTMDDQATNIRYYLRERRHAVEDEASENESYHEEVEEHVSGPEEADGDSKRNFRCSKYYFI